MGEAIGLHAFEKLWNKVSDGDFNSVNNGKGIRSVFEQSSSNYISDV